MPRRMMLRVRRLASTVLAVALASAALVFVTDPPHVAVAATGDECPAVPIWVNTWNGTTGVLAQYSPTGTALSSVPVAAAYGDIGLSTDGTRLFGASFTDSLTYPILYELDPATGSVIDSIPLDSGHITMTPTARV